MSIRSILEDKKKFNKIVQVVFNSVDKDGSGLIDIEELGIVMKSIANDLGLTQPTKSEIKDVFNMLDTDESGNISLKEFEVLIKSVLESLM